MTRTLSAEWAAHNIRVNGIGPGYFETEMTQVFYQDDAWRDAMQKKIPLGRFGEFDDLAGSVVFLSSEAARYITGQILYVDGGYLASI
jgi:NAD(P)-dependent dehydrogenase (short-subunit alcohol dehydrogenase family)